MQPLLVALAATIVGLSLAPFYPIPGPSGWWIAAVSVLLSFLFRRYSQFSLLCLFCAVAIVANLRYPLQFPSRQEIVDIDRLAKKVTLTGTVIDIRQLTDERSWIELRADSVSIKGRPIPLSSPLQVRLYMETGTNLLFPGDTICCESRLRQPRPFGMPGEYNWPRYLASQHVDMTAWVKNIDKITILSRHENSMNRLVVQWRSRIATTIQGLMPENRAYLVRALVLGEGKVIPDSIRKILAKSGISHLFAISGLHLGMIALLGYRLLLIFYRRSPRLLNWQPPQRILPLVLLPLLFGYLILTGDAVSTRRAFVLAGLVAIFLYWRYYVNPLLLLASLALLSLLVNPLLFWQAGWQLSFAGAAGILIWQPLWQQQGRNLPWPLRYPLQLFLVTLAAMLATLPLVLLNFHLLAPVGVIANLICVPIVTLLALPVGFSGLLLYPLLPQLAEFLFRGCGFVLDFVLALASWFTTLPGCSGSYVFLSHWQNLAIALLVVPVLLLPRMIRINRLRTGVVCGLAAIILWQFPMAQSVPVSLTMFSVGQGESMLLQNNRGEAVLIDGGGFYSDRFDVGERLLAPAFAELGVTELTAVVLTHDDLDHRKGLVFILNNFPVKQFWSGLSLDKLHYRLRKVLQDKAIPFKIAPSGWRKLPFWTTGTLYMYNGAMPDSRKNDTSLVMYYDQGRGNSLLLTGDMEKTGVEKLLSVGLPGPVSLLKLPHHGSRFSAIDELIDQLHPQVCFASVGYQNRYHLPAKSVVHYLHEKQVPLYRTDFSGALQALYSEHGWLITHWDRGLFR